MYRIDDNQNVATLPADPTDNVGTPGFFTGGNPGASPAVPPTRVRYWWLNMIQETLVHPILTACGIALAKDDMTQLTQAIGIIPLGRQLARPLQQTTSGSYSAAPRGTNWVRFLIVGSGGAGAGCQAVTGTNVQAGAPGSAGSWAEVWVPWTGTAIPYTVGAAPARVTGGAGNNGGSSGVAGITAPGGIGGQLQTIGAAPSGAGGILSPMPNGTPTGGAVVTAQGQGGVGGLSLAVSTVTGFGGPGGTSILGGGSSWNLPEATGTDASTFGAGGGGTANVLGNGALSGGVPGQGVVIITPFS
jgi:hypothetical protein